MELSLVRSLMDRAFYEEHRGARCPDRLFSKDVRKIKTSIDKAMYNYERTVTPDEIEEGVSCDVCQAQRELDSEAFDCDMDCSQDACDACDVCRDESFCGPCERCLPCRDICAVCDERAYVTLPDTLVAGEVDVLLTNKFGTTNAARLTILAPKAPNDTGADTAMSSDSSTATDSGSTTESSDTDTGRTAQTSS